MAVVRKVFVVALCAILILANASAADAKKKKARRSSGGAYVPSGRGGVFLKTPEPTNPLEANMRAVELGNKGLWRDAVKYHEGALRDDPWNKTFRVNLSTAYLNYGKQLASLGKRDEAARQLRLALFTDAANLDALKELGKLLGDNVDKPKYRTELAQRFMANNDFKSAVVEYRIVATTENTGISWMNLGLAFKGANKPVEAFDALKTALNKSWNLPEQKRELSECHEALGDMLFQYAIIARDKGQGQLGMTRLKNASIQFRRAVGVDKRNTNAARSLAEVAKHAVTINNNFENNLMLATAYQLADDLEHAQQTFNKCAELGKGRPELASARRSFYLAVATKNNPSPDLVATTLRNLDFALQKTPNDPLLLFARGKLKEIGFDKQGALADYEQALALDRFAIDENWYNDSIPKAIARVGGTVPGGPPGGEQGQVQLATTAPGSVSVPATAVQAAPKGPPINLKREQQYAAIEQKIQDKQFEEALKDLLGIVETDPQEGKAWRYMGQIHEKQGDLNQAMVNYRQGAALKDPDAESLLEGISILRVQPQLKEYEQRLQDKNPVGAASSIRDAINIAPELPILHRKLADALKQLGDSQAAEKEIEKANELEKKKNEKK